MAASPARIVDQQMLGDFLLDIGKAVDTNPDGSAVRDFEQKVITLETGRRYARIVSQAADGHGQRFSYGFIDLSNGNVLYAAGWKKPDPIPRGNLLDPLDPSRGRSALARYGVHYLEWEGYEPPAMQTMLWSLREKYAPETITDEMRIRLARQARVIEAKPAAFEPRPPERPLSPSTTLRLVEVDGNGRGPTVELRRRYVAAANRGLALRADARITLASARRAGVPVRSNAIGTLRGYRAGQAVVSFSAQDGTGDHPVGWTGEVDPADIELVGAYTCDDCRRECDGDPYYTFPVEDCTIDGAWHATCTGALCPTCAGPDLEPDDPTDRRRPLRVPAPKATAPTPPVEDEDRGPGRYIVTTITTSREIFEVEADSAADARETFREAGDQVRAEIEDWDVVSVEFED